MKVKTNVKSGLRAGCPCGNPQQGNVHFRPKK